MDDEPLTTEQINDVIDTALAMMITATPLTAEVVDNFLNDYIQSIEVELGVPQANVQTTKELLQALEIDTQTIKYSDHIGIWIHWAEAHKLYKLLIKLITEEDIND